MDGQNSQGNNGNETNVDLCITKDDYKIVAVPGTEDVYTITITNHGTGEIHDLHLSDVNPQLFKLTFLNPSEGHFDQKTGEWTGLKLGHDDTVTIEVKGTIDPKAHGELTNIVDITVPCDVDNTGANSASDTDKLVRIVDLCVTKDDGKCEAIPGTENVYKITITNNGPSEINSLQLSDVNPLLKDIKFENPSKGIFDSFSGEWKGINLGHGDTICIDVKGFIEADAPCGELTNVVTVTVPECVVNLGDDKACDTDKLVPTVDLCITKDDGKCESIPGTENVYKITITNSGPSEISNLHLEDTNPKLFGLTFINPSEGCFDNHTGEWTGLTLGCGETICIDVKGTVDPEAGCGLLTNVVKVTVPECVVNTGDNTACDTDTLVPVIDLCVTKDDGKTVVIPGTENVYLITITNNGPSQIDSLTLSDVNPKLKDITFQNESKGYFDCFTGQWAGINLGHGDTITIEVKGFIPSDAVECELTNVVKVIIPECYVNLGDSSASDTDILKHTVDLCVTKDDGKCEVIPGTENVYLITITNNGPSDLGSVKLTDCNPLFQDPCFQNPSKGCFDQKTGEWTGLNLKCGESVCIEVKGYIPADAGCGELTNVVNVCVPSECYVNTGQDSACDTDKLVPTVDLCVTKDDGKTVAIPGTENVYTITVTNNGPSEINSLQLSDCNPLLQNICFQNASQGCFDDATGQWTGLSLGCGDTICIEVKGFIPADAECGELTNVINVCVPECVVNTGDSSACDTDKLVPTVDLCITKDDGKSEAIPGTDNCYLITITNKGPSEISSLTLSDENALLQNIHFQNASEGSFDTSHGVWSGLSLGCGDTITIEVVGTVDPTAECGELTNIITVTVPECVVNTGQSTACDTDTLAHQVDLCVTKDDGKSEAIPGTDNCYLITITNNGPSELSSLQLTDVNALLLNLTFQSPSEGCFDCATGQWTGLTLGCGETVTIEVVGTVDPTADCGDLTNIITVTVPECFVNTGDSTACDTDKIVPTVDLCITKDDGKSEAIPGTDNCYLITITNNGPSEISSLTLSDKNALLQNITFQNASHGSFDCANGVWTGLCLGKGDTVTIEVVGTVEPTADCGDLTNIISVCVPECVVNTGDSSACDTDKLVPTVDLCITKDDGKSEAIPGTDNCYLITITNKGPSEISSLTLSDENALLQNIHFQNASEGSFDASHGVWSGLSLGCGDTITIEVVGTVDPCAECGDLTNVITVTVPECVVNTGQSTASDTDTLAHQVDLCVTKDDGKSEAIPGTDNCYVITITNNGPSELSSLQLSDVNALLLNLTFQNPSEGCFDCATGQWTDLTLGKGETVKIEVVGTVDPTADCGDLTNIITVTVPECFVNTGDSTACDTDKIVPTVDLCITKDDGKSEAIPGTDNCYLITITNNGPSEISSLTLSDKNALLQNITFQSASQGSFDCATGVWTGLCLGKGDKVTIEVVGTVDPKAGCGDLTNTITVCVPECVVNTGASTACDTDKLVPTVDLCVTKDDCKTEVSPGSEVVYTITVTNSGPSEISSLQLSDVNPLLQDITFQNASQGSFDCATGEWTGLCLGKGDTVTIEVKACVDPCTEECELTNVIKVCVPECVVNTGQSSASDTDTIVKTDCDTNHNSPCPPENNAPCPPDNNNTPCPPDNNNTPCPPDNNNTPCPPVDNNTPCPPDNNNNQGEDCNTGNNGHGLLFATFSGQVNSDCTSVGIIPGEDGHGIWQGDDNNQTYDSDCIKLGACPPVGSLGLNEVIDNTANGSDGDKCKTNLTTLLDNICQSNNQSSNNCQPVGNGNVGSENQPNGEGDSSSCGQPNSTFANSVNNDIKNFEFSATTTSNSASSGE